MSIVRRAAEGLRSSAFATDMAPLQLWNSESDSGTKSESILPLLSEASAPMNRRRIILAITFREEAREGGVL